ncbi:hypothetical protein [Aeromonas media]|uniref:hypothetical protein n=2 Tax=Aeromonas media TaxID=651 RepID=UPI000FABDEF9|nr:hypothetical protein [Aeromonas media]MCY9834615.1 hypothetical protein [Aeromonas media]
MGIVFIIALVLAWPTYGFSLLAIPTFAIIRGYALGKVGRTKDAYLTAEKKTMLAIQQGDFKTPTWLLDTVFIKQLVIECKKTALDAGVPNDEVMYWISQSEIWGGILTAAACFEKEGFGKLEQIVGASDITKNLASEWLMKRNREANSVHVELRPTFSAPTEEKRLDSYEDTHENEIGINDCDENKNVSDYEKGCNFFETGLALATQYRCQEAIDYYTRSINACNNPAPYINRANLLSKRIRHYEAMQDLLEASRLDLEQGNEFATQITRELAFEYMLTQNYRNGVRETLVKPTSDNVQSIADHILHESFGLHPYAWEHNPSSLQIIEYHFFNEIDNIIKFEQMDKYPEVKQWIEDFSNEFITMKVNSCPNLKVYKEAEIKLHQFLCTYEENDMRRIRRSILYRIHCGLMVRDFGALYMSFDSECCGITKEAVAFCIHAAQQVSK